MKNQSRIAIFDLDGCLSDDRPRQKYLTHAVRGDNTTYEEYNSRCAYDLPINKELWDMHLNPSTKIYVVTARPVSYFAATEQWINKHLCGAYTLLMRPNDCTRTSPELKKRIVKQLLERHSRHAAEDTVVSAYDDRLDVLEAYSELGLNRNRLYHTTHEHCTPLDGRGNSKKLPHEVLSKKLPHEVLSEMAKTFQERNAIYGDNYKMVAQLMKVLFPNGVPSELVVQDHFHLFELKLVKLSRFAISGLTHADSIHDDAVYSAMIESILSERNNG